MDIESERSANIDERRTSGSPPVGGESFVVSRTSAFAPASIAAGIAAVALLLTGGISVARAGLDGSLDQPVVSVAGFNTTALLGIIEIAFGVVFLAAALLRARNTILFVAVIGGVMALVVVFQPSVGDGSLGLERGLAILGAIVMGTIVGAALLPSVQRQSVVQRTTDLT